MFRFALIVAAMYAVLAASPTFAHEYTIGSLKIGHPWARATPKGASVGGGYMTITNNGSAPDRLIGGATGVAKSMQVHEMKMDNGIMKMRELASGLEIKPGQTVKLDPAGYHIMFVGLNKPLEKGQHVDATLEFAKAGKVKVYFLVEGIGAKNGGDDHAMPGMSGGDSSGGMQMKH
jgi:copper(I)-binding protein